jgi:hypothetical protein
MNIDKMYEDIQQKIKQSTNLEENKFTEHLLKQDKSYYTLLNDLIQFYPIDKTTDTLQTNNTYAIKLSSINGVSRQIEKIMKMLDEKINIYNSKIKQEEREISNLKQVEQNLIKNNGNLENLDFTSKKLLSDYLNEYTIYRIMFWVKLIIVLFLLYQLFSPEQNERDEKFKTKYMIGWVAVMIVLFILSYLKYTWNTYTTMPKSASGTSTTTTSMTCSDTEYGCCPDGVTPSVKNKLNCGCAKSDYGCCPDGSNKNQDGSCITQITLPHQMKPCNQSTYGCCPDNVTLSNATGSNCLQKQSKPPLCSRTQYGCCPDGHTVSNVDRSNCVGSCAFSEYGCCPNGITISNKDRSNCNVPTCATSKYGCCPDGSISNRTKSNCI